MKSRYMLLPISVALLVPLVVKSEYAIYVITMGALYGILAISLNVIMGLGGVFSLGHAAFWGIGAYVGANLLVRLHMPFVAALIAGGLVSGFAGVVLGIPSLKVRSTYLCVTTMGFNTIVLLVLTNWIKVTRGSDGFPNIPPPSLGSIVFDTRLGKYFVTVGLLILAIWAFSRLKESRVGRAIQATRDNEIGATACGVNVHYYRVMAFALSAAMAGMAGALFAALQGYIAPDTFAGSTSTLLVSMLLIGGSGSVWGPVIGAFCLQALSESMRFLSDYAMAFYGLIIVLVALWLPKGLDGLARAGVARIMAGIAPQQRKRSAGGGHDRDGYST